MNPEELFAYARRIAFKIWKDADAEDAALAATMRCILTFDPSRNVPIKRWLARLVKQAIIHRWRRLRRMHLEPVSEWFMETVVEVPPLDCEESTEDYVLLYENFVDKWPIDVIARRRGWSIPRTRRMLAAAKSRFVATHEDLLSK